MPRSDVGGIRNRLQLLKAAGLIVERANWRYQSTPLGEEVASRTPLQAAADLSAPQRPETNSVSQVELNLDTERLCRELLEAGVASDTPIRLEKAVAAAFAFLGFDARHIGGAGKTDVLLTLVMPGGRPVRTIIDAKSARSGVVNENAVSFDTLIEHKKHHDADFVGLIGPSFAGGLQHPLLQCVATSPGGGGRPSAHHLADRPGLIASKLQMLARSLQGLDEMHDE
jgi:hypothetical protein